LIGSTDRPFASPGEIVELRVRPGICGAGSGFTTTDPAQYDVTIVFTPPQGGPRNVVVLSTNTSGIGTCSGAASTQLLTAGATDLAVVTKNNEANLPENRLQFRFPETDYLAVQGEDRRAPVDPAEDLAPRNTGHFQVKVKAKRWYSTQAADGPAEETTLTILIGSSCYSHAATKKK
jgi:hypothetical protein